jgi:hypothetical protein
VPSFPLIEELPQVVETLGWTWEPFKGPVAPSRNFWLGVDRQGNRWLTKLTGSFYAYREIVFARLAQRMKWSCQSSVFMRLDKYSAQTLGVPADDVHAAHWFLDEHVNPPCSPACQLEFLVGKPVRTVEDLLHSHVSHLLDWPKSEIAAFVFGGHEPPGRLFTKAHEFVIIDSELMFATNPCPFDSALWLTDPEGRPSRSGMALALEVCRELAALPPLAVKEALRVPENVTVRKRWPIAPKLKASRRFAAEFCASHERA